MLGSWCNDNINNWVWELGGDEMEEELIFSFHKSLAPLYADFDLGDDGYAEEKMVEEGGEDWNKFKLG